MAGTAVTSAYPTLVDVTNRLDPTGAIPSIAEQLTKLNPMLEHIPWVEGNLPTGHRIVARTGLPSPTWRKFNEGLNPIVSSTAPYDESCGMLEGYSKIDVDLADLNGNTAAWRASEDRAIIEGFAQEVGTGLFYHSTKIDPEKFYGFSPRYATASGTTKSYVQTIGSCSTTGCYSIWLINWDPERIFGIYPRGSVGGLQVQDLGKQLVLDGDSKQFLAWVTRYQWKVGLCVKDYRYAVRAILDTGDTTATTGGWNAANKTLFLGMTDMMAQCYSLDQGNPHFYMNRLTFGMLMKQLESNTANMLQWADKSDGTGVKIPQFLGIPIHITDLLVSETTPV
jgi:hypothetical protein